MPEPTALVVDEQGQLQVARYSAVIVVALLASHWFEYLTDEISLIWLHKPTPSGLLFILCRYSAFVDVPLRLLAYTAFISPEECLKQQRIGTWVNAVGTAFAELILLGRTYAIYNQSNLVLGFLGVFWTLLVGVGFWTTAVFLKLNTFGPNLLPNTPGCHVTGGTRIIFVNFIIIMLFELVVVLMTLRKALEDHGQGYHPKYYLTHVLYRDGLAFFVGIFGCSLGVIIVSITAPADFLGLVVMFTRVVHSCCSCHVVLNLRKAALKRTRRYSRSSDIPLSALQFTAVSALDPSRSPLPELPSMLFSPGDRRIRGQSRSTS